ncbi:hypothetical protein GOODEAATRI_029616 [Goodea atripinnis]|uniref:Uncharacterized protein n=1 Tax=Goodea atripinnis TaxID=208336 RepID=A0ABV0NP61_9TELE
MEEEEMLWINTSCSLSVRKSRTQLHRGSPVQVWRIYGPSPQRANTHKSPCYPYALGLYEPQKRQHLVWNGFYGRHSDLNGILNEGHDQCLKTLHDYQGEGNRPTVRHITVEP